MNSNQMMIDIESLDIKASTVIISVGHCIFNIEEGVFLKSYSKINIQEQLNYGATVSVPTLAWWMQQSKEAQDVFVGDEAVKTTIRQKLLEIFDQYTIYKCESVWANGLLFDIAALELAANHHTLPVPWKYNAPREMRNFRDIPGMPEFTQTKGVAHNALDDAIAQAEYVIACQKKLSEMYKHHLMMELHNANNHS